MRFAADVGGSEQQSGAASASLGPQRQQLGPPPRQAAGERGKGAGGTRPRPAAVMVSAAPRPGKGERATPCPTVEEEAWSQDPLAGSLRGWKAHLDVRGLSWAQGPSCRLGKRGSPGRVPGRDPAFWAGLWCSGNDDTPRPSTGPIWGFQGDLIKIRWGKGSKVGLGPTQNHWGACTKLRTGFGDFWGRCSLPQELGDF